MSANALGTTTMLSTLTFPVAFRHVTLGYISLTDVLSVSKGILKYSHLDATEKSDSFTAMLAIAADVPQISNLILSAEPVKVLACTLNMATYVPNGALYFFALPSMFLAVVSIVTEYPDSAVASAVDVVPEPRDVYKRQVNTHRVF